MSAEKVAMFEDVTSRLGSTLEQGDLQSAGQLWSVLKDNSLVPFLGSHYANGLSAAASACIATTPKLDHSESQILDDIVLIAAVNGAPRGLEARMTSLIKARQAKLATQLFARLYRTAMEKSSLLGRWPRVQPSLVSRFSQTSTRYTRRYYAIFCLQSRRDSIRNYGLYFRSP